LLYKEGASLGSIDNTLSNTFKDSLYFQDVREIGLYCLRYR
jgi:hypothetical protein